MLLRLVRESHVQRAVRKRRLQANGLTRADTLFVRPGADELSPMVLGVGGVGQGNVVCHHTFEPHHYAIDHTRLVRDGFYLHLCVGPQAHTQWDVI